ncbi:uncharacterized protein LOC110823946 [Carica papaya]|uniref:uncharacterized protein LOC110823946 n=1 Tax=Carica papaya TaxID=3649 RepID=UPI000B8CCFA3|nr:uncharacterized protein LOC110823946 [Carica papaya]
MECNKDEAVRAKEIAERKITEKDYTGARKFTLKAQNLYPQLDGLSQMLTIIDVHISAEKKINGEADWYGVLGVNPLADEETVRRQYRKLALILHPDKNKSRGADGAFKLVSEAWSLLSDKAKRLNYNQKRGSGAVQQKFATQSGVSSQAPSANGFHNSTNTTTSKVRASNGNLQGDPASFSSPLHQKPSTFWTICNGCKTQYEYLRIYLNHTLLCPNCHEAFLALERAPPPNVLKASNCKEYQDKNSCPVSVADDSDEPLSINVPDPDFHNFDLDRAENSFADDQVWAAYDDDDGMPRYYARIHKVISLKPFKMKISWLNSRSNTELGPLDWVGSGFSKTCGDFRCGRHEITETLNSFSHKVQWMKGSRGVIRIYPRKGDVWALYRNWSSDWDEHTPDEVIHKYDMVEVLDDYNEEEGVTVSLLVKVAGLRTVFRKCIDSNEVRRIPKGEMFRFSHQVPNYVLTGKEAPNAPAGFRELDPAATPLELLQVVTEAKETLAGENRKAEEVTPVSKEDEKVANPPEAMKVERVEENKKDKEASGDR